MTTLQLMVEEKIQHQWFADRIQRLMKRAKVSVMDISRELGVSYESARKWSKGMTLPEDARRPSLAALLKVTDAELFSSLEIDRATYNVTPASGQLFDWPLVSWVQAGTRQEAFEPYDREDAPKFQFSTPPDEFDLSLQVRGDSMMRPDGTGFPDGCYIAVKTRRRPKSGEFVVARFTDTNEATFKQFIIDGPVKLLKPLNPAYPTHILPPDALIVGTVAEKRIIERY